MAEYLVLIYQDEKEIDAGGQALWDELMQAHRRFGDDNATALRGGNALQPVATATTIRRNAGAGVTVTDGPFAETKEALGGYYVIEATDLDQAIAIATQVPAPFGGVEVRPVMVFD